MSRLDDHEFDEVGHHHHHGGAMDVPRPNVLRIVARWWWIPVILTVCGLGGSYAYLLQAEDIYESSAYLRVRGAPKIFSDGALVDQETSLETECGVITSTAVLALAVDSPALDPEMASFIDPEAKSPAGEPVPYDRAGRIRVLKEIVSATVVKGRDIIRIGCESPNPRDAADIANAVAKAYMDYQDTHGKSSVGRILSILSEEERKQQADLNRAKDAMNTFRREHSKYTFGVGGGAAPANARNTLARALTEARLAMFDAQAAFEAAQHAAYGELRVTAQEYLNRPRPAPNATEAAATGDADAEALPAMASGDAEEREYFPFPEILYPKAVRKLADIRAAGGEVIPIADEEAYLQQELTAAKFQEQRLAERVPEANQRLVELREHIADLQQRRAEMTSAFARSYMVLVGERLASADARVKRVANFLESAQAELREYTELAAEYDSLESRYLKAKAFVDALASRIDEIGVAEGVGSMKTDSLESAEPALEPSKPNRPKIYVLGAAAGLVLGAGLALMRDWLDHRVRSAEEIAAVLGVPVLGAVPDMGGKKDETSHRGRRVLQAPGSAVAEAVRSIRTSLVYSANGSMGKTILLTSPARGDGKSTIAANLAISLAQAGRKTLIVDTDFRQPCQHTIFELEGKGGLTDVLTGRMRLDAAICSTDVEGLDVLPCGGIPSNPSEMLNSDPFRGIVAQLAEAYDIVLFDSPPTGPVTDALVLGAVCEQALLVVRAEETSRKSAEHARDGLIGVGSRLMGAVVNAVPRRRGGLYSFDGYDGYHAYGQAPAADEASRGAGGDES